MFLRSPNGFFKSQLRRSPPQCIIQVTLNLGLRWDLITWPVEINNRQSNFNIFTGQIEIAGQNGASRSFIPVS